MTTVKEMISRKPDTVTVVSHSSVFDALRVMAEKNIGSVIVTDDQGNYLGIVSETDAVQSDTKRLARSSSSENTSGLVINSDAHFFAKALSSSLEEVVKSTTGISLKWSDCLMRINASRPFMPGILMSRIIRHGSC